MGCTTSTSAAEGGVTSAEHLHLGAKIGKGSYAQVHLGSLMYKKKAATVAVKIRALHDPSKPDELVLRSSFNEVRMWKAVGKHANCVELFDSFFDDRLSYMVMERCNCSLLQYLKDSAVVNEASIGRALQQMLIGISHLHSVSVVHRDVKPDNFLVNAGSVGTVKICDFGLSAFLPKSGLLEGAVGTAPYMSPEMLTGRRYTENIDVWAFGIVAYLLLCGEFPYKSPDGKSQKMKENIVREGPADCEKEWLSDKARKFLQQVLTRDPAKRPSAKVASSFAELAFEDLAASSRGLVHSSVGLPSLRVQLWRAEQTGAFGTSSTSYATNVDRVLEKMNDGVPLATHLLSLKEKKSGKSFTEANVARRERMMPTFSVGKGRIREESKTAPRSTVDGSSPDYKALRSTAEGEKPQSISDESSTMRESTTCDESSLETGYSDVSKASTELSTQRAESLKANSVRL